MQTPPWIRGVIGLIGRQLSRLSGVLGRTLFAPEARPWAGLGSLLSGLVLLAVAGVIPGRSEGGTGPLWWALWTLLLLLALSWVLLARGGDNVRAPARLPRLVAALLLAVCAVLVVQHAPTAYFGRELSDDAENADYASVLRLLGLVSVGLGAAVTMSLGIPERLRSGLTALTALLCPALVFTMVAGFLTTEGQRDSVTHRTGSAPGADGLPSSALWEHKNVSWLWEHPDPASRDSFDTEVTPTGFLLMDLRGVFALDPASGEEVWRFRTTEGVARAAVTPDAESVATVHPLRRLDGSTRNRLTLMDSATGEIRAESDIGELRTGEPDDDHIPSHPPLNERTISDAPNLTDTALLTVPHAGSEGPLTAYDLMTGEELWTREPAAGCRAGSGRESVATTSTGVMLAEECGSGHGAETRVSFLDDATGEPRGEVEVPATVERLAVSEDGSVAVISHQGEDIAPSALEAVAVDPADGTVFADGLPGERPWSGGEFPEEDLSRVAPADGGRLLWTEADVEGLTYRLAPADGGTELSVSPPGTNRTSAVGPATVSESLLVGAVSGSRERNRWDEGADPEILVMNRSGSSQRRVPVQDQAYTFLDDDANGIEAHTAPGGIVVTGFGIGSGDHAHVIGLGPTAADDL